MHVSPDMTPFYEGVQLTSIAEFEPARAKFRQALGAIAAARVLDCTLDEMYREDTIPVHLVETFDTFMRAQILMHSVWSDKPMAPMIEWVRLEGRFASIGSMLLSEVFAVDEVPIKNLSPDVRASACRVNICAYGFRARAITGEMVMAHYEGLDDKAGALEEQGADLYALTDKICEDNNERSLQAINALHAARHIRVGEHDVTPEVQQWLGRAAGALQAGGDANTWMPRTITMQDVLTERSTAIQSIYTRL